MLYSVKPTQDRKWQVVNAKKPAARTAVGLTGLEDAQDLAPGRVASDDRTTGCLSLTAAASQRRSLQSHSDIGTIIENIRLAGLNGRPNDAIA